MDVMPRRKLVGAGVFRQNPGTLLGLLLVLGLSTAADLGFAQQQQLEETAGGETWQYSVAPTEVSAAGSFSMDKLQRRTFHYFWDLADPETGLIPDRYPSQRFCSIAAQGMGYACYVIGVEKGWISREEAAQRVQNSLRFFANLPQNDQPGASGYHGFFYHFLDMDTGRRYDRCELSSIDTTLLMAGVMVCNQYFDQDDPIEAEIRQLSQQLVQRIDWQWMVAKSGHVGMGWKPESGFLTAEWKGYDESVLLHILAAGSEQSPIESETYQKYTSSYEWAEFYGQTHINFGPLFGHQYSQMFVDFCGWRDPVNRKHGLDYFENGRRATRSQIAYAKDNPKGFVGYGEDQWGLTACDGPGWGEVRFGQQTVLVHNYSARGIASNYDNDDGTISPTAAGGSYPYTPDASRRALKSFWEMNHGVLVGRYGLLDSYNRTFVSRDQVNHNADPEAIWVNGDYIGIDQGPILIQTVNQESGLIWKLMMQHPTIQRGLKRLDFQQQPLP